MLVCAKDLYADVKHEDDGLPLGQLKRRMSGDFDRAILLDACQSDILSTRGAEGIAERDLSLIHDCGPRSDGEGTLAVVTSCDAGQTASELTSNHHGLFTMAMLDILESSSRAHRRVDLSDAFRMELGRKMAEFSAREGISSDQRPRFSSTGVANLVLLDGEPISSARSDSVVRSSADVPPPVQPHPPRSSDIVEEDGDFSDMERKLIAELCERLAPEWKQNHANAVSALLDAGSVGRAVAALDAVVDIVIAEFAGANGVIGLRSPGGLRHRPRSYQNFAPSVILFDDNSRDFEAHAIHLAQTFGPSRVFAALGRVFAVAKLFAL